MRRILLGWCALLLLSVSRLQAQTCQGLASFSSSRVQLSGEASLTDESAAVGGGMAYGLPQGPFAEVSLARRAHENYGGASMDVGAAIGYEFTLGRASLIHLCPIAAAAAQIGPNNAFNSGVERSRRAAQLGLSLGAELSPLRQWNIIPTFALAYARQRDQAKDSGGAVLFRIDDAYALTQLGVGLVFKSTLSLRPYVELPLQLNSGEPTVGLTVGYALGRRK